MPIALHEVVESGWGCVFKARKEPQKQRKIWFFEKKEFTSATACLTARRS